MHADIHACLATYINTYLLVNMHAYIHTCLATQSSYTHIYTYTFMYVHTHVD